METHIRTKGRGGLQIKSGKDSIPVKRIVDEVASLREELEKFNMKDVDLSPVMGSLEKLKHIVSKPVDVEMPEIPNYDDHFKKHDIDLNRLLNEIGKVTIAIRQWKPDLKLPDHSDVLQGMKERMDSTDSNLNDLTMAVKEGNLKMEMEELIGITKGIVDTMRSLNANLATYSARIEGFDSAIKDFRAKMGVVDTKLKEMDAKINPPEPEPEKPWWKKILGG